MTDGTVDVEALQEVTYRLTEVQVLVGCPSCGWSGVVQLYDIGDGPEWCCRSCDHCFPSNPVVGGDGKTIAERTMLAAARQHLESPAVEQYHPR